MEPLLALLLAAYTLACAYVVGHAALARTVGGLSVSERVVVGWTLGLGLLATVLTLLGLAGGFWPPLALALPGAVAVVALAVARANGVRELGAVLSGRASGRWASLGCVPLVVLALCVVFSALAPPSDYDGLLYHLVAPRAYLQAGSFVYVPHNFSANLPMFGEMLFAVGLAGGSDRAPQLVHAGAGALAVALTWTLARRLLPGRAAWWAALGVAGTPLVPFLATRAYIDLFTVAFVTSATLLIVVWLEKRHTALLVLAGVLLGFAISSKYSALTVALPLGFVVLLAALRSGPRFALQSALAIGGAALVAALPWTVRQLALLGNPVWPMYFGGRDWDAARVEQLTYFVSQYGSGHTPRDWLLLPLNVFRESWRFGHVPWSFPPLLAIAAPLAVFDRRAGVRWLLLAATLTALLWARGWQDLRYLLSIYPLLAVLGVAGLRAALPGRWGEWVAGALAAGLLLVTLGREAQRAWDRLPVVLGIESAQAFLTRSVSNHAAVTALSERASGDSTALFLGEGQIWYCRPRCLPDPAHDNLLVFFLGGVPERRIDASAAAARLAVEGVQHVLLSKKDFWYLENQDPEDRLRRQLAEFYVFKAQHLELVYQDDLMELYRTRW